jgi:hypothetical protein
MPANYVLLEKITVGAAGASSVTFSSIPQTGYTDLVVKASCRSSADTVSSFISFNGVSTNLSLRNVYGDGSSVGSTTWGDSRMYGGVDSSVRTASTFSNGEIYIPNYTSASNKSFSVDSVEENNGTTAFSGLSSGLWSNTAAITSISLNPGAGSYVQYSTFYLYGVAKLGTTPTISPKATGGDIIETDGTYWYHAFVSSGTFTPTTGLSADVLVVAGGGSGGWPYSGGGGAGGVAYTTANTLSPTNYTVTIGAGAAGAYNTGNGIRGGNSQFGALTAAVGGGGGAGAAGADNRSGGSGGGGSAYDFSVTYNTGGAGTAGQGNNGGNGGPSNWVNHCGGGGGGAGAVGSSATTTKAGNGGAGTSAYSSWLSVVGLGVSGFIAGGGGGGTNDTAANAGTAGSGGGGRGASNDGTQESGAGVANTGGGSGGGGAGNAPASPKNGGSGLVIVRYLV